MKMYKKIWVVCLVCIFMLGLISPISLYAAEKNENVEKKQIIFLLDASNSMELNGGWQEAVNSVLLISEALPEKYETALLAYNTEVIAKLDFNAVTSESRETLMDVDLKGYTNPGVALQSALEMFPNKTGEEQRVVIISDGEISMPERQQTEEAVRQYEEAVEDAVEKGVILDTFILENAGTDDLVSYGTERTSGEAFYNVPNKKLESEAISYLFEGLQLEKIELDVSQTDADQLEINLRDCLMKSAKIVLEAEQEIEDVHVSGQCEQLNVMRGSKTAIAELQEPLEQNVSIEYTLFQRGIVRIYLIKEYDLTMNSQAVFIPEENMFEIRIGIVNHHNKNFLNSADIDDWMKILIDGEAVDYRIQDGTAVLTYPTTETKEIEIDVELEKLNSEILSSTMKQKLVLEIPEEENTGDYTILWIVMACLCVVILFLIYIYKRKRQKKNLQETHTEIQKSKDEVKHIGYDFAGQITVYVLKSEMEDIPPQTIKLYGRGKKPINFEWIKSCCNIQLYLKDADKIRFCGGRDNTLCVKNYGYASIMKKNELLRREKKYLLNYGEKILLIFNDGGIEIELHYKNIKPSER